MSECERKAQRDGGDDHDGGEGRQRGRARAPRAASARNSRRAASTSRRQRLRALGRSRFDLLSSKRRRRRFHPRPIRMAKNTPPSRAPKAKKADMPAL
jgi:hypothetical protein